MELRVYMLIFYLVPDDLLLYGDSEENLRAIVRRFVEVCRKDI